jgi:hypothetical protein
MTEFEGPKDDFSSRYPDIGPIQQGSILEVDQAKKFADLFGRKIAEINENSETDLMLLDEVVNSGSSIMQYYINNYALRNSKFIPSDRKVEGAIWEIGSSLLEIINKNPRPKFYPISSFDNLVASPRALSDAMNNIVLNYRNTRTAPAIFNASIRYAKAILLLLDRIAEYNEGLWVDEYIEARISQITDAYMAAEQ